MRQLLQASLTLMALLTTVSLPIARQSAPPPDVENGYTTQTFTDAQGRSITYYLHIPCPNECQHPYPLVLLLHGGGERGHSGNSPEQNRSILLGDPYVQQWTSAEVQNRWPSFIVVPQIMDNQQWVGVPSAQGSYRLAPQPTNVLLLAKEVVDGLQRTYPDIDPGRLYITGISMGGYGVWDAIERWPDYFAAAAPVSGAGDPTGAISLTHLPIWAFHGANDGNPPASASRVMIQAIRAMGGHPRYTELPQAGHDIWLQVYTSPAFLSWLFAQKTVPDRVFFQGRSQALLHTLGTLLRKYSLLFIGVGVALRMLLWMYTIRQQQGRSRNPRTSVLGRNGRP
jgi:predicted peptidase